MSSVVEVFKKENKKQYTIRAEKAFIDFSNGVSIQDVLTRFSLPGEKKTWVKYNT